MDNQSASMNNRFKSNQSSLNNHQPDDQLNQGMQSGIFSTEPQPSIPATNPGNYTNPIIPVNTSTGDIVLPASGEKKKKGLLIGLICFLAVLLIGGGAFAAVYVINNQPERIAASAMNNLINAENIGLEGNIEVSLSSEGADFGLNSLALNFNQVSGTEGNTTTATATVGFTNGATGSVDLGEVMLKNGVLYLKVDGVKKLYHEILYDTLHDYLVSSLQSAYGSQTATNCLSQYGDDITSDEYLNCLSTVDESTIPDDSETNAAIDNIISEVMTQIDGIVEPIDGQWLELSLPDILESEMLSEYIPASSRQSITKTYNCYIDTFNNFSNYTPELSSLYEESPFVVLTSGQDSYYDLSLDATNLATYLSAVPHTQLYGDLASCSNVTVPDDEEYGAVSVESVESSLKYLPKISAKFDGFLDHHLTDLKISQSEDGYSISSDLHFTYPDSIKVETPSNTRPVMEVVEEVYQKVLDLSSLGTTYYYL